ncbi:DUF3426 domain-containing protein [Comamonas odontotermitis]|uniref:DUF3426 domain-containing protein n=1 Tax=Comamonas odontotermitis TaxID=379895 RepID=UPI0037534996
MSQITRCPQCQTRFKVVDDQLRISDGWVRCGKCKSVFDALTHLVQRPAAPAAPATAGGPVASSAAGSYARPGAAAPPSDTSAHAASVASGGQSSTAPVSPADAVATREAAVLVTGNSMAVDPHANAPELSVLVFPRRGNFGESGYVDSSWMSAYEDDGSAEAAKAVAAAPAAVVTGKAAVVASSVVELAPALESEWSPAGQRPDAVRQGQVGFSAQDDLAELQARESRLMEAIAEQRSRTETKVVALQDAGIDPGRAVSQPAPAPARVDAPPASVTPQEEVVPDTAEEVWSAPERDAKEPGLYTGPAHGGEAPLSAVPEMADRLVTSAKVEPSLVAPPNFVAEMDAVAMPAADAQAEPGFVRDAKRRAFWGQPWVLAVSGLCAVLLLAVLLIQVGIAQRDRLAMLYPQWRPALEKICQAAGCQIALPRQLQSVSIDSTSFNPMGPGQFRLTVVLRNAADHAVAMPALELSLNDAAEKLVLRRVLSTADLQAPAQLAAHGEWTGVVALGVADRGQEVVGYRVQAFYP